MSAIQIKKRTVESLLYDFEKKLINQADNIYKYNHFKIGKETDKYENLYSILMVEALSNCYIEI